MRRTRVPVLAVLLLCLSSAATAEPRWRLQYFHDELHSTLAISDIKFPTPRRGLAVGMLQGETSVKPVMVSTNDGGETWSMQKLKEDPVSLFFLNDSLGWMATDRGIWRTEEAGRSWSKIGSFTGILRVHFLDENRGFAIGSRKVLLGTTNGGKAWSPLQVVESIRTSTENTVFSALDFVGGRFGIIAGWSRAPRRFASPFPDWMDPEAASRRREVPATTIVVETRDGGVNWKPQVTSAFGRVSQLLFSPSGIALSLVEFDQAFEWPSEVFLIHLRTGKSVRAFREKDRAVTSMLIDPPHTGYLAAIECTGTLHHSPIPGKLHILRATGLKQWNEMRVDYRAVAHRATLAAAGTQIWVATDTGMILKLQNE
jgi:photosystem II stability/assembly factor-like uncharacterized protein